MGACRYCKTKMTHEEFQAHRCPMKVESELFAQRFPERELAAKTAFAVAYEKRQKEGDDPFVVHAEGTCSACDTWRNTPCSFRNGVKENVKP